MTASRLAVAAIVVVALGAGIAVLRATTMTRHQEVPPDSSLLLVLDAEARGGAEAPLEELVRGLVGVCQLEVAAGVVPGSIEQVDGGTFHVRLRPTLDEADQRQLRGCLQDVRVDHLLASVAAMRPQLP